MEGVGKEGRFGQDFVCLVAARAWCVALQLYYLCHLEIASCVMMGWTCDIPMQCPGGGVCARCVPLNSDGVLFSPFPLIWRKKNNE